MSASTHAIEADSALRLESENSNPSTCDTRPKTAILLERGGIGDLVLHIPYFRAAAAHSCGEKITIIARPTTFAKDLISHEPWVDEIIYHDLRRRKFDGGKARHASFAGTWRIARELCARRLDRIMLFTNRSKCGLLAWLARIPRRAGFGFSFRPNRINRIFLNEGPYIKPHDKPTSPAYWDATNFAIAHGLCAAPIVPRVTMPAEQIQKMHVRLATLPRPFCALTIGAGTPDKQWGASNYAALAGRLIAHGNGVLLIGGPAETPMARAIENAIPPAQRTSIASLTQGTVLETASALSLASLCIGNDTGGTLLAAACNCPAYIVLGPRQILDHDPGLRLVTAPRLDSITAARVFALVVHELGNEPTPKNSKGGN